MRYVWQYWLHFMDTAKQVERGSIVDSWFVSYEKEERVVVMNRVITKNRVQYHMPSLRRIKMKIISSGNVFFSAWVYLHQHRFDRYGKLFQLHRRTILYIFGIIIVMILSNYLNNYYICSSIRTSTYNLSYVTYYLFYINMNVNKSYPYYSLNFITMFAKPNR